ncbi:S-layer homology domain-containing protein [Paenibacillus naphthalenovorans]|uniref:S-layer protein n=1 Tax=Paenibacillus naphthalenovorans TaxID=162209 RepID=A0A0U2UG37_9BACL|nr:S-layer homology domain-containing protein [Paenibacillus naphthalenovorans]ALS25048.1 S-layer protein [Paenibacillus naphthalenovorans]
MKENKIYGKRFSLFMMIAYLMTLLVPGEVFATSGGTISTVAGNGIGSYSGDGGAAASAQLNYPFGVAVDSGGILYIVDTNNCRIRKVDASGNISTVAGTGTAGYSGDGGAATSAQLNKPYGVAVDSAGNLYIADTLNHRVRKVDASGNVSTVAGTGTAGSSGDGGAAASAQLNKPFGVAVDSGGNLYIADTFNHRIRKVDASGNISTVAGTGTAGNPGEGEFATSANIKYPYGVAVDSGGNLFYVADDGSSRVRKVDASGKISTVAGNGTAGSSGDGGAAALAQLYLPYGVAVDSGGNLYIADTFNHRVRKVDTSGNISTVAGNGTAGSSGDGGAAASAQLNYPYGVAVDSGGNLYIADTYNQRVRKVAAEPVPASGLTVTASDVMGPGTDGKTQLSVTPGADTGNKLVYKNIGTGTVTVPNVGDTLSGYTDLPADGIIAAANDDKIAVAEVDGSGKVVKFGQTTAVVVAEPVPASGLTVTSSDVTGAGTDGKTKISIAETVGTGHKFVYKNFERAAVSVPNVGDTLSGYTDLPADGIIAAANDDKIAVAEVDGSGKVVKFGQTTAVVVAEPVPASGLTVTSSDVTGAGTDGKTKISVAETVGTGHKFVYKNFERAAVSIPNVGDTLSGYTDLPADGIIAAANDDKIAVAEVDGNGKVVKFGQTTAVVVAEPVPASGLTVTSSDVTGAGTDGKTKISVAETVGTGHKFVYKNFEGAAVSVPNVGDTLSGYTDLPADGIIAAANDDKIAVAEVDGSGKVVKFGQTTAVVEANPASPPTLTADSTNNYTTFAIEITFIDDAAWRSAITAVKDGSKTLNTTDYRITAGKITINAGVLSAGFHTVTVVATGYADAVVTQNVNLQDRPANPQNLTATAGNRLVNLNWNTVTGATYYNVYMSEIPNAYGETALATVTGATYQVQNLTNGMTYYFVVKAGNPGGLSAESNEVHATPATVPAAPTNVAATAGNGSATITFTAPDDNGGSAITGYEVFDSNGNKVATGSADATSITITGLTNGTTYTFTVKAKNATGSSDPSTPSNAVTPRAPSNNHHDDDEETGSPSQPASPVPQPANAGVDVLVNGKTENTGTLATAEVNGQRVTTVAVDEEKLQQRLAAEGAGAVVTIPVTLDSDVVVGELNGRMIKNMENLQAVVELRTEKATYTLPAERINIDAIAERFGQNLALQDIKVKIEIAQPDTDIVRIVENAANREGFALVVPPLDFKVTAVYGDQTEEVARFSAYVERTIAIPEGIDPQRITTGVVIEPDGSTRHVPTKVIQIDGKYYAKINSLTNSTYSVVWHPLEFDDVANHWAKDAVNDMGSRMVIEGIGNGLFDPDRDITRAEFAAIIVRALGLKLQSGTSFFSDVKESDWYSSAVRTAYAYHLVGGFEDGTFRPNDMITREQAMVILSKAMTITNLKARLPVQTADVTLHTFGDAAEVSAWAQSSVADSVQAGIVSGRSGTALAPKDYMTRAEVATIIQRLLQKSGLI